MVDCCKLLFNILTSILILMGMMLAGIGFYGPSLLKEVPKPQIVDGTESLDKQLNAAFFGIAVTGLGLIGLAVLGLVAVNMGLKFLIFIFATTLIGLAVVLLIFSGLAFAAVYSRTTVFKNFWRPKMEKFDPKILIDTDFAPVQAMQSELKCCGLSGEDVYAKHKTLPISCCREPLGPGLPISINSDDASKIISDDAKLDGVKIKYMPDGPVTKISIKVGNSARQFDPDGFNFPTLICDREKVKALDRKGCDVAGTEQFITMGKVIAYASLAVALYLISIVVTACCIRRQS